MQLTLEKIEACPICKNKLNKPYLKCVDYSVSKDTFQLVQCTECTFTFTNPRPNQNQIVRYYQSADYISHSDTNKGIINKLYHVVRKKTLAEKLNLINRIHDKGHLLDVGCGTGAFLQICKKAGWIAKGSEPDKGAREVAESKLNINIEVDILTAYREEKFDVITLWHVLEHVHQLNKTIEKIISLMSNTAKLVIAVPNINSHDATYFKNFWAAYDTPRHLYHFSQKTLETLMSKHGIKLDEIIPMKFDAYYISLLSTKNKYNKINFVEAIQEGYKSNTWAENNNNNYSSLTYVFSK